MPMARLSALVGLSFFMAIAAGCGGDDTSSLEQPPVDVNVQLAKVTKERDEAQAELKKEREAEMSNLARFEAAEAAATTGNDELRRQLHTLRNQFTETQKELEKARKEAADLKAAGRKASTPIRTATRRRRTNTRTPPKRQPPSERTTRSLPPETSAATR